MKIGCVVNNLANSEINYQMIKFFNQNKNYSPYIFICNHITPIINPEFYTGNITTLSNFNNKVIVFDLECLDLVKSSKINGDIYIYLQEMEWLYKNINYEKAISLLSNVKIAVRSDSHKNIVSNYLGDSEVRVFEKFEDFMLCLN